MNVTIREMKKSEAALVQQIGRASFSLTERLSFPRPAKALLAIAEDEIVGAAAYKIFKAREYHKVGYVEIAFVKQDFEGQGIGSKLYAEATAFLKKEGCETVTALVRDDNVASWKLFEKNGYHIISFSEMNHTYGLLGSLRLWFDSLYCVSVGHHLYSTALSKKPSSFHQLGLYFLLNFAALIPALLFGADPATFFVHAFAFILPLVASIVGGGIIAFSSKDSWSFRTVRGGFLISLLIAAIGNVFPIVGRFYPDTYEKTPAFVKKMGLEGFCEWLGVLILVIASSFFREQSFFWNSVVSFGTIILLYRCIPFFPFESLGGGRIWAYNKVLSCITFFVSVAALFLFIS